MSMVTTNPYDDDKLHEECALFGIYGNEEASAHTCLLYTSDAADE